MAAWQVEQDVCTGRGFDANGMLGRLMAFVPKSYAAGGPAWYIHDNQSALDTDPYVVISSHNAAGPNVVAKYIRVKLPTATAGRIDVEYYLYWDPVNHVGRGTWGGHNLTTLDAADFIYDFRGGPEGFVIQTLVSTNWESSWIDEIAADPNLLDSVEATTAVTNITDAGNQVRGLDITAGLANAVDANGYTYLSVIFVSGSNYRVDMFSDSARTSLVWRSSNFGGLGSGSTNVVGGTAQNGSGITAQIFMQGITTPDAAIAFRATQITVGVGEGPQFTEGNYYFIYDLTLRAAVNSFRVVSRSGDVLTVDRLYRPFPLGAKIGSYPHKFMCGGTGTSLMMRKSTIPYFNVAGTMLGVHTETDPHEISEKMFPISAWIGGTHYSPNATFSTDNLYLNQMSPDRRGRYAVQRPGVVEIKSAGRHTSESNDGQSAYGQLKNIIVGVVGSMAPNLHGRTLSGIDYTYFRTAGNHTDSSNATVYALMIRETESVS